MKETREQLGEIEAITGSLEIWTKRAEGEERLKRCPLCKLRLDCLGCPILLFCGSTCGSTPYDNWSEHQGDCDDPSCPTHRLLAAKELAFLWQVADHYFGEVLSGKI